MNEQQLIELRAKLTETLGHVGLVGHDLQTAIACCIMDASSALEPERQRSAIRLVEDDHCDGAA